MRVVFGHFALLKLRPLLVFILFLFVGAVLIMPTIKVNAAGALPSCSSGGIYGGDIQSYFTIKLSCENLPVSMNSAIDGSLLVNASNIRIWNGDGYYPPENVSINGDELSLVFNANYGSRVRDVIINTGAIKNDSGELNARIVIPTVDILDFAIPKAVDDVYSANLGSELVVPAELGLLANDSDGETSVRNAIVSADPINGALNLNPDGSFTYMPNDNYPGNDSFSYSVEDEAGNINTAVVYLSDNSPEITVVDFSRDNPQEDPNLAKVGDRVKVVFQTNEPVEVDSVTIAGHSATLETIDSTHFAFYYDMQADDTEGIIYYSIEVHDSVNNSSSYTNEIGVYFDKTKPVIDLKGEDYIELEIDDPYIETAEANDDYDGQTGLTTTIVNTTTGSLVDYVNTSAPGTYLITYSTVDSAGNLSDEVIRTVVVLDSTNVQFAELSERLRLIGLDNNLDTINYSNLKNFSGLYIEKIQNGQKVGRIIFNNEIDLTNPELYYFLDELVSRIRTETVGEVSFDVSGLSDLLMNIFGKNAVIKFYNLNKLGFNNRSTVRDVLSKLEVYDDNGVKLDALDFDEDDGAYIGCVDGQIECFVFTLKVNHFSRYVINKITYQNGGSGNPRRDAIVQTPILNQAQTINGRVDDAASVQPETLGIQTGDENTGSEDMKQKAASNDKPKVNSQTISELKAQWWLMALLAVGLLYWFVVAFIKWLRNRS